MGETGRLAQDLESQLEHYKRDVYMMSDQKQNDRTEIGLLRAKYEDVLNEVSDLRDYQDRVANAVNSCVGIIGVFLKGLVPEALSRFIGFKSLGIVNNGNLLDVT